MGRGPQRRRWHRRRDDEEGLVLVFVAFALVAVLALGALAIDGGNAYATRRLIQNASDSGAMAGAQALRNAQLAGSVSSAPGSPNDVYDAVLQSVQHNSGSVPTNGSPICTVVGVDGATAIGSGDCTDPSNVLSPSAAGVLVASEKRNSTFLAGIIGQSQVLVRTTAAATAQPVTPVGLGGPWIVCGNSAADPAAPGWDLLDPAPGSTPPYQINVARAQAEHGVNATGPTADIVIQQNNNAQVKCGAGNGSFDGKGNNAPATQGGIVYSNVGNGSNPTPIAPLVTNLSNGCQGDTQSMVTPCNTVLPIVFGPPVGGGNGRSDPWQYTLAGFGIFRIDTGHGNVKFVGRFVDAAHFSGGISISGKTCAQSAGNPCVVKLTS